MRIFFFISSILLLFSACNNDVTSIGQDLIDDVGSVDMISYDIVNTYTIKLDSFPTSMGETGSTLKRLLAGNTKDPITGQTTVTPYFEIVPSYLNNIDYSCSFDSILFYGKYTNTIWGDTNEMQVYRLYQTEKLPTLEYEEGYLLYNNASLPYDQSKPLGTFKFLPIQKPLSKFEFRLDDSIGRHLFEMLRKKDENITNSSLFVQYFKGLALVPDENNTCLLGLSASPDSLGLRIYYRNRGSEYTYNFTKSAAFNKYTFMNITHNAAGTPYEVLKNQKEQLQFKDVKLSYTKEGQAVTQGADGYMMKMRLPIIAASDKYRTIVKAEIVIYPQDYKTAYYSPARTVNVYISNNQNKTVSAVTNAAGQAVTGTLYEDATNPENTRYVINITDYYNKLTQQPNAYENNHIIISVPLDEMNATFNRLVTDEIPVLNVYFAKYDE